MSLHLLVPATPFTDARAHLDAELALLDVRLHRQVMRLRAARLMTEDQFRGLYIPDEQVDALLRAEGREEDVTTAVLTRSIDALQAAVDVRCDLAVREGIVLPLVTLRDRCALGRFEIELLLIAAAPELDLRYQTLYAYAQNDVTRRAPTVDLALQLLCESRDERLDRRAAFRPDAPLLRDRLVRLGEDSQEKDLPLLAHPLRTDTRVIDFILGRDALDTALLPAVRVVTPKKMIDQLVLTDEVCERILNVTPLLARGGAAIVLEGARGTGRKSIAEAICGAIRMPMLVVDGTRAAAIPDVVPLLRREALLSGRALVVDDFEKIDCDGLKPALRFLLTTEPVTSDGYVIEVPMPSAAMRARLWREAGAVDADDSLATKFVLTGGQIGDAVRHARASAAMRGVSAFTNADLVAGAHAQSSAALRALAQKVELRHGWKDIVLPSKQMQQLREICISMQFRRVVFEEWGFDERITGGKGLAVLFNGPSGTGKTMAASIVAHELGLQMYRVDLSSVVSKYIGETEKNLSRIFAEAQASNAVLFFDEADAIFGKRSEVKDAHDRYANIEVAYLLQRVESYEGIVVLATNLGRNIDEAFARRMQHTIEFPFPDVTQREQIWSAMFPTRAPRADDVDFAFLAKQFELSGGNIRNVVVAAAFNAAAESNVIGMRQLIAATARELQKIGRLPSRGEFREYYDWIREP